MLYGLSCAWGWAEPFGLPITASRATPVCGSPTSLSAISLCSIALPDSYIDRTFCDNITSSADNTRAPLSGNAASIDMLGCRRPLLSLA